MIRLGVVSFLNARPLVTGLRERPDVQCCFDVPARLAARLAAGEVDAALIPVVDLLRAPGRFQLVSDAGIACDGETMTVRVFSQVPPNRVTALEVDPDSHTSVLLARVIWRDLFDRALEPRPMSGGAAEAVLLIGDKVVDPQRAGFAYEVDLGGAWRAHTGLPFVFAVWATAAQRSPAGSSPSPPTAAFLDSLLSAARDRGVARAAQIAETDGPPLGWPVELARRYLTRCMKYRLDERAIAGANLFARRCAELGLLPAGAALRLAHLPAEPAHA